MSSAPSGNDSGQWEKNYQSVCALGIVHGGWEEAVKEEICIPQCLQRFSKCEHILIQREDR